MSRVVIRVGFSSRSSYAVRLGNRAFHRAFLERSEFPSSHSNIVVTEFFVLALPGYKPIEQLACVEVFTEARALCGSVSIHPVTVGSSGELWKIHAIVDSRPNSVIVVCSGSGHALQALDFNIGTILSRAWRSDVTLCATGDATKYLASLGLLDGRRVAARPDELAQLRSRYDLVRWDGTRLCQADRNLVSSVGFIGAVEASLVALGCVANGTVADVVARRLHLTPTLRADTVSASGVHFSQGLHPAVQRAAEVLHQDPLQAWTTAAVAKIACVSERHLQRLFKSEFSCGILEYIQKLRLQRAMSYFRSEPYVTLEKVAEAAGFSSTQQLRRIWRKEHGYPPSVLRRQLGEAASEVTPRIESLVGI
jgi:transcriptional regulator GlxA family with amidase domain